MSPVSWDLLVAEPKVIFLVSVVFLLDAPRNTIQHFGELLQLIQILGVPMRSIPMNVLFQIENI